MLGDEALVGATGDKAHETEPPYVAISDNYLGVLRSGRIHIQPGRLVEMQGKTAVLEDGTRVNDIDSVILCTGYDTDLGFLDPAVQEQIGYDPTDRLSPLLLYKGVFPPPGGLPGLAFVGMYRGPYFGVMELMAVWMNGCRCSVVGLACLPLTKDGWSYLHSKHLNSMKEGKMRSCRLHQLTVAP